MLASALPTTPQWTSGGAVPNSVNTEVNVRLLFNHCLASTVAQLGFTEMNVERIPGFVVDELAAAELRLGALASGRGAGWKWLPRLGAFVRELSPAFAPQRGLAEDAHIWTREVAGGWSLALTFDTHPGRRVGKVFAIKVGVAHGPGRKATWLYDEPLHSGVFAFDTEEDLETLLPPLGEQLRPVLEGLARLLETLLVPGLADPERALPRIGPLTCQEALEYARSVDDRLGSADLLGAGMVCEFRPKTFPIHHHPAAQLPEDGQLTRMYAWSFGFADRARRLRAQVPFAGRVRLTSSLKQSSPWSDPLRPIASGWLDSPEVAARLYAALAEECTRRGAGTGLVQPPALRQVNGRVLWSAYLDPGEGRAECRLDGYDGSLLSISRIF